MDFGRNKSKFQEVPETGITFDDVAVSLEILCAPLHMASCMSALLEHGSWINHQLQIAFPATHVH